MELVVKLKTYEAKHALNIFTEICLRIKIRGGQAFHPLIETRGQTFDRFVTGYLNLNGRSPSKNSRQQKF